MVGLQLGNIYLLLAMVGIAVLYTTTEAKTVRNYLIALWLADIGHVAVTCYVMEYERMVDFANWNAMAWGNIGATVSIFECCGQWREADFQSAGCALLRSNCIPTRSFWP
jgi:hypothetical protein